MPFNPGPAGNGQERCPARRGIFRPGKPRVVSKETRGIAARSKYRCSCSSNSCIAGMAFQGSNVPVADDALSPERLAGACLPRYFGLCPTRSAYTRSPASIYSPSSPARTVIRYKVCILCDPVMFIPGTESGGSSKLHDSIWPECGNETRHRLHL